MKVLMQIRKNYLSGPGGDTIQLLKTKEFLEYMGVDVDVSTELEPDLSEYDVVHLFNLTRIQETYIQAKNAVKQKKPIALSTIYWPFNEFNDEGFSGVRKWVYRIFSDDQIESLKAVYKYVLKGERNKGSRALIFGKYSKMQKWVAEVADICLPNAVGEMIKLEEVLGVKNVPYVVVPNAIDEIMVKRAMESKSDQFLRYKDYIICVARISRRKNQIMLVNALKDTEYKLLFVGKSSSGEMDYYNQFLELIKGCNNIEYIESIPNEELYNLYKECKVSILPSWFETPGLVSLEAAAMGCNVAVTDKGTTKEYFGSHAFYFELDEEEIKFAVDKAYCSPRNRELQEKVLKEYTWENAAKCTLKGYQEILKNRKKFD